MFSIQNNRLQVTFADPGECSSLRFNHAGFITSVLLDHKIEFMDSERGGTGGAGLCSDIEADPLSKEAKPGDYYVKFGVGFLRKKAADAPKEESPEQVPFDVRIKAEERSAVFTTPAKKLQGYALFEEKTFTLQDNLLTISYFLRNEGEKPLPYREYIHNFFTISPESGTDPYLLQIPGRNASLPFEWRLIYEKSGHRIIGRESFLPEAFQIWSPGFTVCPEFFIRTVIEPGESLCYSRSYRFE